MNEITLNLPINGNDVTANVTEEEIGLSKVKQAKGLWTAHLPKYTSPSLNDDSVSSHKLEVENKQDALKVDGFDFRLHYDWNPLSKDIASTLIEDLRETAEKRYNAKNVFIRLDLENPTCYIFGKSNNSTGDSTAPLENIPTTSAHHHKPTSSASPASKPTMPVNNENLIRRHYELMISRITEEYEANAKKLKDKLLKQRHAHEIEIQKLEKHYKRQLKLLQRRKKQQPRLELPKNDQQLVDWVNDNWKRLEPAFKHYANSLYMGHNELVNGGKDGKGDQFEAKRYKQQAINIMALQFKELFNQTKQKSPNEQPTNDKSKSKDDELSK